MSESSVCTNEFDTEGIEAFNVQADVEYGNTFENTALIRWYHESPPRFGHGSDLTVLIDGTPEQKEDYIWGLLTVSIIIFCIFVVWNVMLLIFKGCGPKRVGFLSGRRVPLPSKSNYIKTNGGAGETVPLRDDVELEEEWDEMYQRTVKSQRCMKYLVIFAGLSIVTCAILLAINGFNGLLASVETGLGTIDIVKDLLQKGINLIDAILANNDDKNDNIAQLLVDMNTICPATRAELCTNLTDIPGSCNFEDVFDGEILKETMTFFANLRLDIDSELTKAKADLQNQIDAANELQNSLNQFDWALYCSIAFSLGLAVLILLLMFGACFKLSRATRCLQNVLLVPLFCFLVVLSWAFSMAFVIGSMGLADFCYDSPDTTVLKIINTFESDFSKLIYTAIIYYISGCPASDRPDTLTQQAYFVADSIDTLSDALVVEDGLVGTFCDSTSASASVALISRFLIDVFCSAGDILRELRDFLKCDNWYPLYENTIYDAVCYEGTDGFAWVTITQFIIVFMAMVILTFRIVFYDIDIEEDGEEEGIVGAYEGEEGQEVDINDKHMSAQYNEDDDVDSDSDNAEDERSEQPQQQQQQATPGWSSISTSSNPQPPSEPNSAW